jgi:hypothetical protein
MANEITLINDFVIGLFESDPLVNTISIVPTLDVDSNKENVYPLVNADMTETDIQTDAIIVSYTITVLQQRDVKPVKTNSKLLTDSNYLDNLNETHSIASRFINYLRWKNNNLVVEVQTIGLVRFLKNWGRNGCDGVQFDIDLSIHNKGLIE